MKTSGTIARLGTGAVIVLALAVVPGPEAHGQCDGVRGHRGTPYVARGRVLGHRYGGDYFTRPKPSRLSYPRERQLGRRGTLSLYPGPPDAPHRGRLFTDYSVYSRESRLPRYRPTRPTGPRGPRYDAPPADSLGAPSRGGPPRTAPPRVIVDPTPPRDRRRGLPRADAERDRGWTLLAGGETVRALGRFAGLVAISGSNAEARVGYALAAALYGDDAAAETAMQLALKIDPGVLRDVDVDEKLATRLTTLTERYADASDDGTGNDRLGVMTASLSVLLDAGDEPILAAR